MTFRPREIGHGLAAGLIAALTTSVVDALVGVTIYAMEFGTRTYGKDLEFGIVFVFLFVVVPALLLNAVLAAARVKLWWAYAAAMVAAALVTEPEFSGRLVAAGIAGGLAGGLAAFAYLKYAAGIWETDRDLKRIFRRLWRKHE